MDFSQINLYERVDEDLFNWQRELEQVRKLISAGELESEHSDEASFREARKKIKGLLDQMEQTRQFVAFKQAQATAEGITSDVEGAFADPSGLFVDDQLEMPFNEHLADLLDENSLE